MAREVASRAHWEGMLGRIGKERKVEHMQAR